MSMGTRPIKLQEDHLRLIYDGFRLVDDNGDGFIDQCQYATLTRALGQTISNMQIGRLWSAALEEQSRIARAAADERNRNTINSTAAQAEAQGSSGAPEKGATVEPAQTPPNTVGFQAFIKIFTDNYTTPESEKAIMQAFQLLDKENKGKLSLQQLQEIATTRGEPLPKAEFEELVLVAGLDGQKNFDYSLLAKRLASGPAGIRIVGMMG